MISLCCRSIVCLASLLSLTLWSQLTLAQSDELDLLPWQQNRLSDRVLPFSITNSTTAKQMLEISGIGDSQLRFFIDHEPITGKDIDTTGYILRHFHELDRSDIKRWAQAHTLDTPALLRAFLETPDDYRVDFYRIRGRVIRIQRQPVVEEAARLLGFKSFFWVWLKPNGSETPVRIATRKLPIAWFPDEWKTTSNKQEPVEQTKNSNKKTLSPDAAFELNQPAAVDGLLLKVGAEESSASEDSTGTVRREIVMAAQRVEWLPTKTSTEERINAGVALMSQFEFDAGLLDDLRRSNGKVMNRADTEAFFQIISIVNTPDSRRVIEQVTTHSNLPQPTISDYLQNTRELQGELVTLKADIRQITKIEIRNEKMKFRLGLDHYWQLDAFVYLGGDAIELKTNEEDKDGLVYKHRYPVQICLVALPPKLQEAQTQIQRGTYRSNSLHENITLNGFFFKLWAYQSARTIGAGGKRVQLSPLFIASNVVVHEPTGINIHQGGIYLGLGFAVLLLIVAGFVIKTNLADNRFRKHTESTRHSGGFDEALASNLEAIDTEVDS